ncbi:hypothetical protein Leryth_017193, partial [Lithospermum erythrorhizon]
SHDATTEAKGKHRISAELTRIEQEARLLEEELAQLNRMGKASDACVELVAHVEAEPDPLLPLTRGPENILWDWWFEREHKYATCECCIL